MNWATSKLLWLRNNEQWHVPMPSFPVVLLLALLLGIVAGYAVIVWGATGVVMAVITGVGLLALLRRKQ